MIASTRKKLAEKEGLTGILRELFPYLGLLLMIVLFSVTTNGKFLRIRNLTMILKQSVIVMIGASFFLFQAILVYPYYFLLSYLLFLLFCYSLVLFYI